MKFIKYFTGLQAIWMLLFLIFGLSFSQPALALNYSCGASNAPWHQDRNTGTFVCVKNADKTKYTTIDAVTIDQIKDYATRNQDACQKIHHKTDCAICNNALEQCVRLADCESTFSAEGYSCGKNMSSTAGYDCIRYHCIQGNNNVCCRKTPTATEPTPTTPVSSIPTTPVVETVPSPQTYTLQIDDCCGSIVPPIPRDSTTGELLRDKNGNIVGYSLNDVVQTAINIYECILCIVGALIFIMLVVGATVLIISGGSADRVALGRKMITGAIVGGVLALSTYLIIYWTIRAVGGTFIEPYGEGSGSGSLKIDDGIEMVK